MLGSTRGAPQKLGLAALVGMLVAATISPAANAVEQPQDGQNAAAAAQFRDIAGNEHRAAIEWLAAQGLTTGYPDGTYRPLGSVNRDAMAAFIYRLAGEPTFTPPARSPFSDVPTTMKFYKEMAWMNAQGIATGFSDGTYRPLTPVKRDAMAAFMNRYAGDYCNIAIAENFPKPTVAPFADVPVTLQFSTEIAWMKDSGISRGWTEKNGTNTYRPLLPVARDAMAAFIQRLDVYENANGGCKPDLLDEQPWRNPDLPSAERASLVAAAMTLDQKIAFLQQDDGRGVPEFGLPPIRAKDGSSGLTTGATPTTALPSGVGLASTFDPVLARAYGTVSGEEARATGWNHLAGPTMDLTRTPFNGRMWEGFGEDPLLNGTTAAAQVQGEQSAGVSALVKHYNLNNFETRRGHVNVQVDERTLQEVYTRPWEKVVKEADPGAVMCSFNLVNSSQSCGSDLLLNQILKKQLGFNGYVSSDFNAGKSLSDYAAGLDTSGPQMAYSGANLKQAVLNGTVPEARVTNAAERVAYAMFDNGIFDNPPVGSFDYPRQAEPAIPASMLDAHAAIATEVAGDSVVLLKNESSALPLASSTPSVAVIGSDADHYIAAGGSGTVPRPAQLTTILDGITARAGSASVEYAAGTDPASLADTLPGPAPIPSTVLTNVQAQYRMGLNNFGGNAMIARSERQINLRTGLSNDVINSSQVPGLGFPLVTSQMSAVWTGTLAAPTTGTYKLSLSHLGTARLFIDGRQLLADPGVTYGTQEVAVSLTAGKPVAVRVEYVTDAPDQFNGSLNDQPGAMIRLGWTPPEGVFSPAIQEAVALAKRSSVAVVVARDYTGEAADRGSLKLPQDQDRLIKEVSAANPNTIVVLATSGPVTMPWIDQVPAVIEAWYAGQAQGTTVAGVLYGDINPSGKLPITFPVSDQQATEVGVDNPFDFVETVSPVVSYDEGVFVGYRAYSTQNATPLFPFGHGLSYTSFRRLNVDLPATAAAGPAGPDATVSVQVRNTGTRAGEETVQVYAGFLPGTVPTPARQLAGYGSLTLTPGATGSVDIKLDPRSLQYWDAGTDAWVTPTGPVPIYVGSSVADAQLAGTITLG
ncbi:glycoside hydrolase family 3 C-terminal domain-containing protein [Arthrobacter burdickii]|uniref:Glycoside hydrolase family 3 C-terminal domain-containing protein n=1 Tax=Arthrobacter burdickii TaxID=3035920 RepID=A0ABT8K6G4_9MICC|nr:glycoside hydrolase family 3 C-terminal domain-containing protein [Arthrobacter burdickii]MDN4612613.1 glycoside hydrolase family 3 C-terminal domain-containing protein [Arthrobacter burdickii]